MLEGELQKARQEAATLEARLVILRQRARAGARSMQDRGTDRSGRSAAGASWAYARLEAEKVERELRAAQKKVQELESKPVVATGRPQASGQTVEDDRPTGVTELRNNTLYYTHEQAARRLGVSISEIEALITFGTLLMVEVGGKSLLAAQSVHGLANDRSDKKVDSTGAILASSGKEERMPGEGLRREAYYYTPRQAAEMLGVSLTEVNELRRRNVLSSVSIDKHLWYSAVPLEDLVRQKCGPGKLARAPDPQPIRTRVTRQSKEGTRAATSQPSSKGCTGSKDVPTAEVKTRYYTSEEVSQKLGKTSREVWNMALSGELRVETVGGQRLFCKRSVDNLTASGEPVGDAGKTTGATDSGGSPTSQFNEADEYYTVEQVAQKLGMDDADDVLHALYIGRLKLEEVRRGGQRVFSKRSIDSLLRASEASQVPQAEDILEVAAASGLTEANAPPKPKADSSSASAGSNEYYTVEQVAEKLGMYNADEVWHMPNVGQLKMKGGRVGGQRVFSKAAVDKLVSKHEEAQTSQGKSSSQASIVEQTTSGGEYERRAVGLRSEDFYYTPAQAARILGRHFYRGVRDTLPTVTVGDRIWVNAEAVNNLAEQKYGVGKLHNAPTPHRLLVPKSAAQEEGKGFSQVDLGALRAANERLVRELQREREERSREVQRMRRDVDQLEAELENFRRSSGDGALGLRLRRERELRQEAERRALELHARLDEEKLSNSGTAERLAALEAELDHGETRRKALEEALYAEKEKTLRLEKSERLLNEMRRLLGATEDAGALKPDTESTSTKAAEHAPGKGAGELQLRTPFGQVFFMPPFPLAKQEEELLRLIAKEDELTAEQLRRYTGRRRVVGELEDLLDRLADEGVNDLVVEVSEDRYRFNPAVLQDD